MPATLSASMRIMSADIPTSSRAINPSNSAVFFFFFFFFFWDGPSVWTGRALQAESDDLEKLVLRICIRPIDGAFELLAIMDIRARSISFTTRPRRPDGPPDHERAGETFLHLLFRLQTLAGKPTITFGDQPKPSAIRLVNLSAFIRLLPS